MPSSTSPLGTPELHIFQSIEYGELLSEPMPYQLPPHLPLQRTSRTPLPPALSLAFTLKLTVEPLMVALLLGLVQEPVGGVVSVGGGLLELVSSTMKYALVPI